MKVRIYKEVTTKSIYFIEIEAETLQAVGFEASDGEDWSHLYSKQCHEGIVSRESLEGRSPRPMYEEPHP